MAEFVRPIGKTLTKRLSESRKFIQVLSGPRQVGKTTLVQQILSGVKIPSHYASADDQSFHGKTWIEQQWEIGRLRAKEHRSGAILVLDEIQKIPEWSETIKRLWDADTKNKITLKLVLLGSSPLLLQRGLTETLAGRFEVLNLTHWSFPEMRDAFGWNSEQYIFYGGFPGSVTLINNYPRWSQYVKESLIETTIARDVLLLSRIDKPVLLRRVFELASRYSGQILSYQKMLGQLQDAGNTTTLASYLDLLTNAGMVTGLQKFAGDVARQRGSSPKFQVMNTALMTSLSGLTLKEAQHDREYWGRLVESAVGAHLVNNSAVYGYEVFYWRERNREVDFILKAGKNIISIEIKSGRSRETLAGMTTFAATFKPKKQLLISNDGISVEEFLSKPVEWWI